MRILSIGIIFATISRVCSNFFSGIGKPQISSKMIYTAAIFNLISNLILIPALGIIGAAITTTFSYLIMMGIGLSNIKKFIKIKIPTTIWIKTFINGLIMILVIWVLKKILFFNIWVETFIVLTISTLVYIALLFLLNIISTNELRDLYNRILK